MIRAYARCSLRSSPNRSDSAASSAGNWPHHRVMTASVDRRVTRTCRCRKRRFRSLVKCRGECVSAMLWRELIRPHLPRAQDRISSTLAGSEQIDQRTHPIRRIHGYDEKGISHSSTPPADPQWLIGAMDQSWMSQGGPPARGPHLRAVGGAEVYPHQARFQRPLELEDGRLASPPELSASSRIWP